jgi:hypothetical protein
MSDLANLFRDQRTTNPPLAKRLFASPARNKHRPRSIEPHKDTPPRTHTPPALSHTSLPKRQLPKTYLRKELTLYNNQILLSLARKTFFLLVAILAFHLLLTHTDQPLILANLLLAATLLHLHLGTA